MQRISIQRAQHLKKTEVRDSIVCPYSKDSGKQLKVLRIWVASVSNHHICIKKSFPHPGSLKGQSLRDVTRVDTG